MLLHNDHLEEYSWKIISYELTKALNNIYEVNGQPINDDHILM